MTNSEDRLERIEINLEIVTYSLQDISKRVNSNAKAIESLTNNISEMRGDIASTNRKVDALVETITLFSVRSETRLNRLEDAVVGIERILDRLTRNL